MFQLLKYWENDVKISPYLLICAKVFATLVHAVDIYADTCMIMALCMTAVHSMDYKEIFADGDA